MNISQDTKLDFDDVLIRPKRSTIESRQDIILERDFTMKWSALKLHSIVPIFPSNMDTTGTTKMANAVGRHRMPGCLHKFYDLDVLTQHYGTSTNGMTFLTVGLDEISQQKLKIIKGKFGNNLGIPICLDVANGYIEKVVDYLKYLRETYPQTIIMAGNVVTPEMTEQLILSGADIVKVGIGPGSVCTTRLATGVGYPQFSAIAECKDAAHGLGGLICSDGGCRTPGDVCKAFGAGADFVMLGGMFAGTDECDGQWTYKNRYKYSYCQIDELRNYAPFNIEGAITGVGLDGIGIKNTLDKSKDGLIVDEGQKVALQFYGMSSKEAQEKYNGGQQPYRAAEGKSVTVPYKGPVDNVIQEILGGLRSACAYVGAKRLKDFDKCCSFVRVNNTHNKVYE